MYVDIFYLKFSIQMDFSWKKIYRLKCLILKDCVCVRSFELGIHM